HRRRRRSAPRPDQRAGDPLASVGGSALRGLPGGRSTVSPRPLLDFEGMLERGPAILGTAGRPRRWARRAARLQRCLELPCILPDVRFLRRARNLPKLRLGLVTSAEDRKFCRKPESNALSKRERGKIA